MEFWLLGHVRLEQGLRDVIYRLAAELHHWATPPQEASGSGLCGPECTSQRVSNKADLGHRAIFVVLGPSKVYEVNRISVGVRVWARATSTVQAF